MAWGWEPAGRWLLASAGSAGEMGVVWDGELCCLLCHPPLLVTKQNPWREVSILH